MKPSPSFWSRHPLLKPVFARVHLLVAIGFAIVLGLLLPHSIHGITRMLIAWGAGIAVYLLLTLRMMNCATVARMKQRSVMLDEGRFLTLLLAVIAAAASLAAIFAELADVQSMDHAERWLHMGLVGATVLLSWCFLHTIYALHYAHEYYAEHRDGHKKGLDFHDDGPLMYWDFMYFSFIIGATAQTADVEIVSANMRRIALAHCMLSFFFNMVVLALTVNTSAALFS